ncbi:MAG: DUF3253 domain-containing protein [Oligoflexus sp.]|nr:DUF3253 domain-containing protein [Oligoflexus sp.]
MSTPHQICEVCHRPSPDVVCSRRCGGLAKLKRKLDGSETRRLLLAEVRALEKDSTICPGRLSKRVLDQLGVEVKEERDALSILRETLFLLRQEGEIRFFQKNQLIPKAKGVMEIKGPIRVKGK